MSSRGTDLVMTPTGKRFRNHLTPTANTSHRESLPSDPTKRSGPVVSSLEICSQSISSSSQVFFLQAAGDSKNIFQAQFTCRPRVSLEMYVACRLHHRNTLAARAVT
ncbi:hypothetical protein RRG08_058737 [Elysia crispata]|uniref:Uncharacterized protein n=1 Tax=Elysia crispata TaxID=231223 RepID=A0AAE0YWR6_9GAST|nr:hypothetical protein RRG08_058737 [Elysia crispata]